MNNFYIVHLEDESQDRKEFRNIFHDINDSVIDCFKNYFSFPNSKERNKGKEPVIELKQYNTVKDLCEGLINSEGELTEVGRHTLIFFLDYIIKDDQSKCELEKINYDGNNFLEWLAKLFASIPIVIVTAYGAAGIPYFEYYLPKDDIHNKHQFLRKLSQLMEKWWKPEFSSALEMYSSQTGADSWHTPGHNAGNAFLRSNFQKSFYEFYGHNSFSTDLSVSVDNLGDLSEPEKKSPMSLSMKKSAEIFGALETYYITNGTSTSNKAMLMTLLVPGEIVLLDRNCHKSIHQAVVMSGAIPIYLSPGYNKKLGIYAPISKSRIIEALEKVYSDDKKPRMLILTTCTYEGIIYPVEDISYYCNKNGILFYADEAWAPYLRFHPYYKKNSDGTISCRSAIEGGAHFSVQSTHKALAAFSQASMIHISLKFKKLLNDNESIEWSWLRKRFSFSEGENYKKFRHDLFEKLRYWHSTSPHYPMIATLDRAGIQMRLEGINLIEERLNWLRNLKSQLIKAGISRKCFVDLKDIVGTKNLNDYAGYLKDPLKLVLRCNDAETLKKFKIICENNHLQWEKSTRGTIEFLITIGTTKGNIEQLVKTMLDNKTLFDNIIEEKDEVELEHSFTEEQIAMSPYIAANDAGILKPLDECMGKICGQMVVPYPPGIPVLLPGIRIKQPAIDFIKNEINEGSEVHGIITHNSKYYIKVVADKS